MNEQPGGDDRPERVFAIECGAPADVLTQEFGPLQRERILTKILEQAAIGLSCPDASRSSIGPSLAALDAKLVGYRATLDAGGDPVVVAGWIAEVQAERRALQALERCEPDTIVRADVRPLARVCADQRGRTTDGRPAPLGSCDTNGS